MNKTETSIKTSKINRKVMIAVGSSRHSKKWKNLEISYEDLVEKLKVTTRTRESFQEYKKMSKAARDEIKDVGGFVGGALKQGRRKAENLANRSLITLDLDNVSLSVNDLWDSIIMLNDFEMVMYSTHSHEPNRPRQR
jgi:putative DNA primase/helicase